MTIELNEFIFSDKWSEHKFNKNSNAINMTICVFLSATYNLQSTMLLRSVNLSFTWSIRGWFGLCDQLVLKFTLHLIVQRVLHYMSTSLRSSLMSYKLLWFSLKQWYNSKSFYFNSTKFPFCNFHRVCIGVHFTFSCLLWLVFSWFLILQSAKQNEQNLRLCSLNYKYFAQAGSGQLRDKHSTAFSSVLRFEFLRF